MKENWIIWIVAAIVVVSVGAYLVFGTKIYKNGGSGQSLNQATASGAISIENFTFQPGTLNVKKGDTITWQNNDSVNHRIKADDGSFDSGDLAKGEKFSRAFQSQGIFNYSCSIHPSMKGKIVVE